MLHQVYTRSRWQYFILCNL